jgi:hypothetical protein
LHIISAVALTIQSAAERAKARYAHVTRQSARRINEEFDDEDQWMAGIGQFDPFAACNDC